MKFIPITIPALLFVTCTNASPTHNEFERCNKLAIAILEYCLKDGDDDCWSKSKTGYQSCRKDVIQRHVKERKLVKSDKSL